MKQTPRIYYTEAQKAMMWDRCSKGDTLHQIGKLFDRPHTSIHPGCNRRNLSAGAPSVSIGTDHG